MENDKFFNPKVPSFEDINNDDVHNIGGETDNEQVSMHDNHSGSAVGYGSTSVQYRSGRRRYGANNRRVENEDDGRHSCDPTIAHVKTGLILLPVDMTLPKYSDGSQTLSSGNGVAAPSFSINQSRLSLFAAFPPPPIIVLQPRNNIRGPKYNPSDLNKAQRQLKQSSGFHTAMGVTSATSANLGYSDTLVSLNYRMPSLISLPTSIGTSSYLRSIQQEKYVGNMHYNLHLGSTTKVSLGSTLSTLDGRTRIQLDVGNPFYSSERRATKTVFIHPSQHSDYTINASHDVFFGASSPLRVNWMMKLAHSPLPIFLTKTDEYASLPLHVQHFGLTVSNDMNTNANNKRETANNHPTVSFRLGYGVPLIGSEGLWASYCCNNVSDSAVHPNNSANADVDKSVESFSTKYSTNVKLNVEQHLSESQSCQSTLEYRHAGQGLSLGTIITRAFGSSRFSRLGVGVQYSLLNIFNDTNWWKGTTRWLFQLERGGVRFLVPITIYPQPLAPWDSLLRLCYASLATILADTIVGELLCGVTSKLRLSFLKMVLGEDKVGKYTDVGIKTESNYRDQLILQQLAKARHDAMRQVRLMMRQAKAMTKKEEENGGLVIIKAVFGVIDDETRQWIHLPEKYTKNANKNENVWHTIDATTQLQFWVKDSSLHLPAVSKKHMLGFYDPMAFVSEGVWDVGHNPSLMASWWRKKTLAVEKKRNLVVVLSVRYKWGGKAYDVMFYDEDAVDLPSRHAEEISL